MNEKIREQILAIRDSGETNMLDVNAVMSIAARDDFYELLNYLLEHKNQYVNFIFTGKTGDESGEGLSDGNQV